MNKNMNSKMKGILFSFIALVLIIAVNLLNIETKAQELSYDPVTFKPVFDASYYLARYPELARTCGSDETKLFNHFINTGMNEGRQASAGFNVLVYISENPDLKQAFGGNISLYYIHYVTRGYKEGRIAVSDETNTFYDLYNDYYSNTVFVGDSIMLGYRNYCGRQSGTSLSKVKFLCAGSYSVNNALKPVNDTNLHPVYQGEKVSVWDGIKKMNAKHVYIMFGTNDLAISGVDGTVSKYITLIDNIKKTNPEADINIISMTYTVADYKGKGLNNTNIKLFNSKLKELCDLNGYTYVDIASLIDDGTGNLKAGYCSDGFVHLNMSCYSQVWNPVFSKAAMDKIIK